MAGHLLNPGKQDKHKAVAQLEVWPGDRHAFLEQWFGNAEASLPKYASVWFCLTVPHGQSDGQSPRTLAMEQSQQMQSTTHAYPAR